MKNKIRHILVSWNTKLYALRGWLWSRYYLMLSVIRPHRSATDNGLVVSLTSYPKRFDTLHFVLEGLLQQTLKPQKVILWLSEQECEGIPLPERILAMQQRGVEVRYVGKRLKSYGKLIYSYKEMNAEAIVTADDDVIYPPSWLSQLWELHLQNPQDIICHRGISLLKDGEGLLPYNDLLNKSRNEAKPVNLMPTGCSGVLYPKDSLSPEVLNEDAFMELCPHADDVWFKAMSLLKGTKIRRVKNKNVRFPSIGSDDDSLYRINVMENGNDSQIKAVFEKYNLYAKLD